MARRTFPEGFKEQAVAYPGEHPEKSMKQCAEDLRIGYSTLRRWIDEASATVAKKKTTPAEAKAVTAQEMAEATEEQAPLEMENVDEALAEAAEVLEDLIQELDPVVVSGNGNAPLPEAGFTIEDAEQPTGTEALVADEPSVEQAEEEEEPSIGIEEKAPVEEHDELDDDPLFASIGSVMSGGAVPHDEDYAFRCKSHPSTYKDTAHMAGDVFVAVTAQIGNVIEGVTDGMSGMAERLALYQKRARLKKERRILKKEKEKRLKH